MVLLTVTTGAVDATCFLALGKVFASVITGNLVLIGLAGAVRAPDQAILAGLALAGYAAGVLIGAPIAAAKRSERATWPVPVTVALGADLCLLVAFAIGWELAHGAPGTDLKRVLLVLLAIAMGIQTAAVRRLGQMSSTYLTSTLTGVLAGLVTPGKPDALPRSVAVLVAIVAGAFAGGWLAMSAWEWLPVIVLGPAGAVVATAAIWHLRASEHARRETGR